MSGGNQRELARAKNMKKQQEQAKKKGGESGVALKERKERCEKCCPRIPRPNIRSNWGHNFLVDLDIFVIVFPKSTKAYQENYNITILHVLHSFSLIVVHKHTHKDKTKIALKTHSPMISETAV